MNFIQEERENIIKNNNTAQEHFLSYLEKGDSASRELVITEALHGNLDGSVLESQGYKNVRSLELKPGEITSLSNLPKGLEKLVVSDQLLTELENLPKTLRELDCQKNHLRTLDVSSLNKLKVLRVSENQLRELNSLPDSLEEIYCDNNHISVLNLRDLLMLRVLHISNNKAVILENLPPSIVDFKSDNNPYLEIQYANLHSSGGPRDNEDEDAGGEEKVNYIESLMDYFKMKQKYEEQCYRDRKRAFENAPTQRLGKKRAARVIPKCIQCKQPGGTIFSKKEQTYYAVCGNPSSPCHLDIEIFSGKYYSMEESLEIFGDTPVKTAIICQKMDHLFHYEDEDVSLKKFKENMEEFSLMNEEYNALLEKNNQLYKDDVRFEMMTRKKQQIYELMGSIKDLIQQYEKDGNHALLKAAVEIQVQELNPEIHNLRLLRYEIMEMELKQGKKPGANFGKPEEDEGEENVVFQGSTLYQRYASLQKKEVLMGKPSRVVKYRLLK